MATISKPSPPKPWERAGQQATPAAPAASVPAPSTIPDSSSVALPPRPAGMTGACPAIGATASTAGASTSLTAPGAYSSSVSRTVRQRTSITGQLPDTDDGHSMLRGTGVELPMEGDTGQATAAPTHRPTPALVEGELSRPADFKCARMADELG